MGCGASKVGSHVVSSDGMGNVARAWDEMMASKPAKVPDSLSLPPLSLSLCDFRG
jgi:hypothetical protein